MQNKVMKYMTRMGQNTGMLKHSNIVHTMPMTVDLVTEYQNLNSGSRLMKGLNSSLLLVGSSGPSSATNCGTKNWLLGTYDYGYRHAYS